jgi:hypothetical protein
MGKKICKVLFGVKIEKYDTLSESEKENASNNGSGAKYASYLRVIHNGKTILLESDAMEPEDAIFLRDLSWVKDIIFKAYLMGLEEGRNEIINHNKIEIEKENNEDENNI